MKIVNKEIVQAIYELDVEYKENNYKIIIGTDDFDNYVHSIYSESLDSVLEEDDELFAEIENEILNYTW